MHHDAKGRKKEVVFNQQYHLFVLEDESESIQDIKSEADVLRSTIADRDHQLTEILEEMARIIAQYESTIEQQGTSTPAHNKGKTIEEVSPRQVRRKLQQFTTFATQALWFSESFGLMPDYIQLHKINSLSPVKVALESLHDARQKDQQPSEDDSNKVLAALYILDRFAVSDESYHELSMASNLPPLYKLKRVRIALNESLHNQAA